MKETQAIVQLGFHTLQGDNGVRVGGLSEADGLKTMEGYLEMGSLVSVQVCNERASSAGRKP